MYCTNCGAQNEPSDKFCKNCGAVLDLEASDKDSKPELQKSKKQLPWIEAVIANKRVLGICIAAVMVLLVITGIVAGSGKTINLNKYVTVEVDGYDGYGTARITVDWNSIEEKYGKKIRFTSAAKKELGTFWEIMSPMEVVQECISIKMEDNGHLSNGDKVAYVWDVDENLSDYVKCKIKYKNSSFEVSDLEEIETFDAFEKLTVEFSGIAPDGKANLNYTGDTLSVYDFQCDKTNGLSNGDVVTVAINESKIETFAKTYGKIPAESQKTFQVNGLKKYLQTASEIDDAAMDAMQKQASDVFNAYVAQNWSETETLESFEYLGNYLLTSKDKSAWGCTNCIYLVYKAQVHDVFSNDKGSYDQINDIYWYISYNDLMLDADNSTLVDITKYDVPYDTFVVDSGLEGSWWSIVKWYYKGYESLDDLYKSAVTKYIDSYNHEDNVK